MPRSMTRKHPSRHHLLVLCALAELDELPSIKKKTVGMMGLKGVPGLRLE